MFFINLKIAFRNFLKNKGFFLINISGLTIGLSVSLLIFLWAYTQLNFDRFNIHYRRIYQFQQRIYFDKTKYTTDRCGGAIGPSLTDHFPEIESFARFSPLNLEILLSYIPPDDSLSRINMIEKTGIAVDSTIFDIFSYTLIKGNPANALVNKNSIILTIRESEKFFGKEDPMGKFLLMNDKIPLEVTGVMENVPYNSNIKFEFLIPFSLLADFTYVNEGFEGTHYNTYFLLNENADYKALNGKIPAYMKSITDLQIETDPFIIPLKRVHLHDEKRTYVGVYSFTAIAILILLTACINFINLTTARSFERSKEVGIKKTSGATKYQLVTQFLTETILVTLVALFLAIILTEMILPVFNKALDSELKLDFLDFRFYLGLGVIVIITGFMSGIYPAFALSSFKPVYALKNIRVSSKTGSKFRKILVVAQFVISIFCILCTAILVIQLRSLINADPGFNKDNLIIVPQRGSLREKTEIVKQQLSASSAITDVTTASDIPDNVMYAEFEWGAMPDNKDNKVLSRIMYVDYDFAETFRINMKSGRFYSRDYASDSTEGMVINQAVADHLGYDNPVGQPFYFYDKKYTIIGIINDFNFSPIQLGGKAIFLPLQEKNNFLFVKYSEGSLEPAVKQITTVCKQENPNYPPEYFLFNEYDRMILRIARSSNKIMLTLTPLALFISCLGLIGLSIFTAESKAKEIGIRKTFGAPVWKILFNLFREFGVLISLAILISMPLVYLLMNFVLNYFSPRIVISPLLFLATAGLLFILAFIVTGWQSFTAATRNPIQSLRYE